jgi:hypothetical protein
MTPAYLPFTTPSEITAPALFRFFKTIALYRPQKGPWPEALKPWLTAGRIEERVLVRADDEALTQALAACRQWALERDLGSGGAGAFLKAQPSKTPLYDEDAVGRLRRQILNGGRTQGDAEARNPIFDARLFLSMAEAYDRDNENAALQLKMLQAVEDEALRELHGTAVGDAKIGPSTAAIAAEDRGAFMTAARLRAWSILASQAGDLPPLLVTDSSAAAAELLEHYKGAALETPVLTLQLPSEGEGDLTILQDRLLAWLDQVAASESPASLFSSTAVDLTVRAGDPTLSPFERPFIGLYLLEGYPWERLLGSLIPREVTPRWRQPAGKARHGVLGVVYS